MSKFQVNDKVVRADGEDFISTGLKVHTVKEIRKNYDGSIVNVYFKESSGWLEEGKLKHRFEETFQSGDRVVRSNGNTFTNGSDVVTVDYTVFREPHNGGRVLEIVYLKETNTNINARDLKLAPTLQQPLFKEGDTVEKKSKLPFANGQTTAIVERTSHAPSGRVRVHLKGTNWVWENNVQAYEENAFEKAIKELDKELVKHQVQVEELQAKISKLQDSINLMNELSKNA